jgi:hypothetical protein
VVTLGPSGESTAFATYTVDVTSVVLARTDATTKQAVSRTVRVDLADPSQVARLLAAPSMSSAEFAGGTITLDYSNADIQVNVNGVPTPASVRDAKGAALAAITLPIQFASGGTLKIDQTHASHLALSVDLGGTNAIDTSADPVTVTVRPAVLAVVDPDNAPTIEVTGTLARVDTTNASAVLSLPSSDSLAVTTTDSTVFEINGTVSFGSAGAASLSGLGTTSSCTVFGSIDSGVFTATRVLAGASVPGNTTASTATSGLLGSASSTSTTLAAFSGTVIARNDAVLTVRGGRLDTGSAVEFVPEDSTVLLSGSTAVSAADDTDLVLVPASVSVGQRIVALGAYSTAGSGAVTLDASAGIVRLEDTVGYGILSATSQANGLEVNLQQIAGLPSSVVDFRGAQLDTTAATDLTHYEVSIGALDVSGLSRNSLLRFSGIATAFSTAPPNFFALALDDSAHAPAHLIARWNAGGGAAVLSTLSASEIVIDSANASLAADHRLEIGPQSTQLASLSSSPPIVPDTSGTETFGLQTADGQVTVYSDFATFTTALKAAMGVSSLATLSAQGRYGSSQFSATEVLAQMQ